MAINGLFATPRIMSALPPKADIIGNTIKEFAYDPIRT